VTSSLIRNFKLDEIVVGTTSTFNYANRGCRGSTRFSPNV